ncbi:hypothetical protein BH23GEM9_BH23GEM9_17290 [soil metagenome]
MKAVHTLIASALLAPTVFAAAPALAQDVKYETVTKVDLPGAMGTAMRLAARLGGGSTETVETTFIKGKRMRTDADKSSTIMDVDAMRMVSIDHDAKTYSVFTFDEMIARAREAGDALKTETERRDVSGNPNAEAQLKFRFAVEDARQRERIAGYNASRFFLTMQAEGEYVPEGAAQREKGGTLVVLTEMWASTDIPAYTVQRAFGEQMASEYTQATASIMQGIAAAFAEDPQIQVAFEQSTREAGKIEGMPVRSIVRFITVAPDKQFDRQAAVELKPAGPSVAAQAARAGLRGIAGRAAGAAGRQQEERAQQEQPAEEMSQVTFLTVTTEIRNVSTSRLDASLFEPPAGYREVKL